MAFEPPDIGVQPTVTSNPSRTLDTGSTDSRRLDVSRKFGSFDSPRAPLEELEAGRGRVLQIAARLLSRVPLREVRLQDVSDDAGLSLGQLQQLYSSLHAVGAAILDHERSTMATIQRRIREGGGPAVDQVLLAFRLVGVELERDVVMRAGVRLAQESKHAFPERRLEPTRTWDGFLENLLRQAQADGQLRADVDVSAEVHLALQEALQVRDALIARQHWSHAADLMEQIGRRRITAIRHRPRATDPAEEEQQR